MKYSVWLLRDQRGVGRTDTWFPMPLRAIALPTEDRGHHIHEEPCTVQGCCKRQLGNTSCRQARRRVQTRGSTVLMGRDSQVRCRYNRIGETEKQSLKIKQPRMYTTSTAVPTNVMCISENCQYHSWNAPLYPIPKMTFLCPTIHAPTCNIVCNSRRTTAAPQRACEFIHVC